MGFPGIDLSDEVLDEIVRIDGGYEVGPREMPVEVRSLVQEIRDLRAAAAERDHAALERSERD